jgi:uncharacterized metal-binding protein YceD (DUF177 family)
MQFKVKDIGEQGVDVDLPVTATWLAAHCPDLEAKPGPEGLRFTGRLELSGQEYLLRGQLVGALSTTCSRCLEPAALTLDVPVSVVYVEKGRNGGDDDDTLDAPDVLTFEEGVVDLGPEVRDEILLAFPVSVLCGPDCAGLCSVCGGNRNLKPCECAEREAAKVSKLAGLAKFKS